MKQLLSYLRANVPVLLWGPPGVGKTATVNAIGKQLGLHVETLIASLHEPVDFQGWPVVVDGQVRLASPPWYHRLENGGILFLDEISNAPPAVQAALLRVILERVVGDKPIPSNVYILAAANPPEIAADGYTLSPPLANRMAHVEFQLDPTKWSENFPSYWGDVPQLPGIDESVWLQARSVVAAFIRRRQDLLLQLPKDEVQAGRAWPSPRSWDHATRLMAIEWGNVDRWADLVVSTVGEGAGLEFVAWFRNLDLPDPEEVLADPQRCKIPSEADKQFAIVQAVCAAVASNLTEPRWLALGTVLKKVAQAGSDDIASLGMKQYIQLMRGLMKDNPRIAVPDDLLDLVKDLHIRTGIIKPVQA